jgi:hypothetical protein
MTRPHIAQMRVDVRTHTPRCDAHIERAAGARSIGLSSGKYICGNFRFPDPSSSRPPASTRRAASIKLGEPLRLYPRLVAVGQGRAGRFFCGDASPAGMPSERGRKAVAKHSARELLYKGASGVLRAKWPEATLDSR